MAGARVHSRRRRAGLRNVVASAVLVAIAVAALPAVSAATPSPPQPHSSAPTPQVWKPLPHTSVSLSAPSRVGAPPAGAPVSVTWPAAGDDRVDALPAGSRAADAGWRRVGRSPVSVTSTDAVAVHVASREGAAAAGVDGVLVSLELPADTSTPVKLDYSGISPAVGGSFGSRLRLVSLPACSLTTPTVSACRVQKPLPDSANDARSASVTATLTTASAPAPATPKANKASSPAAAAPTASSPMVVAATAGPSGSNGSYAASSLAPSGTWAGGGQSGAFTWSYPISVPAPASGALAPKIALGYDSSSVDGRIANTNNQPSWIGSGWEYSPGFVERSYVPCANDPAGTAPQVYDLCWAGQRVNLSLAGRSTALVRDDVSGTWHPASDDGTKVELLTGAANGAQSGEHWKITTPDGTAYYFGRTYGPGRTTEAGTNSTWTVPVYGAHPGDPCYNPAGFAASACTQAWRWNLDYVEDTHGNAAMYYYTAESNNYGANNDTATTGYTRGGYLNRIDYGLRDTAGSVYTAPAPQQVAFTVAERCIPGAFSCDPALFTSANAANWPDTPQDQQCTTGSVCNNHAPTFWSTKRLTKITTQVRSGNGSYLPVDDYALTQSFPNQGDPQLWLNSITRTGHDPAGATLATPPVSFGGQLMANRVQDYNSQPPMLQWRLTAVTTETGSTIMVTYTNTECTATNVPNPSTNSMRCFPVYWTLPYQGSPTLDFFHKYLVSKVEIQDPSGLSPNQVTTYGYLGAPAWHYDDNELVLATNRTWGQFRGYAQVETRTGNTGYTSNGTADTLTLSRSTYFRGMDGDTLPAGTRTATVTNSLGESVPDAQAYLGAVRESQTFNGSGGAQLSSSITDEATMATTATRARAGLPAQTAVVTGPSRVRTITTLAAGGTTSTDAAFTRDSLGRPTQASETGTGLAARCTTTSYADNAGAGIRNRVAETIVSGQTCPAPGTAPSPVLSTTRTYFDGSATLGTLPGPGDPTRTDIATSDAATFAKSTQSFDASGRATQSTTFTSSSDTTGRSTTTAYTPADGGPLTKITATNALGQSATSTMDAFGRPISSVNIAGQLTSTAYDALGRLTGVWQPGQSQGTTAATTSYEYLLRTNGPEAVTTRTLVDTGTTTGTRTSISLYDAMGQLRQTQTDAEGGGRTVTDSYYDSHGWAIRTNNHWYTTGTPGTDLITTADSGIDSRTTIAHDGLGRATVATEYKGLAATWNTTTIYGGDRTTVIPPPGGTTTTTLMDPRGQTTALWQYTSAPTISGSVVSGGVHTDTTYHYTATGQQDQLTDTGGHSWTMSYDLAGRLVSQNDPDTGTTTHTYNDAGDLTTLTDARGPASTRTYTYDALGRRVSEAAGNPAVPVGSWTYDTLQPGRLTSSSSFVHGDTANPYTIAATGYDAAGNPTGSAITLPASEGTTIGGKTYTTSQTWTSTHLPRTTTPAQVGGLPAETLTTGYTPLGSAYSTTGVNQYVGRTTFNPFGQPSQLVQHDGDTVFTTYTQDPQTLRNTATNLTANYQADNTQYTYDPTGNITKTVDVRGFGASAPVRTACYQYDPLRQLTAAWTATDDCAAAPTPAANSQVGGPFPSWLTWTFADGARTSQTTNQIPGTSTPTTNTTYAIGAPGHAHAVTSASSTGGSPSTNTYSYDPSGNTTTRALPTGTQALTWTPDGKLETVNSPAGTTGYVYTADGSQLIRRDPGKVTVYLPGQELTLTTATGVTSATRYYTHGGTTVAERTDSALPKILYADSVGTTTIALDWSTYRATRRTMDPYGNAIGATIFGPWPDQHGYLDKPTNPVTGLTDIGARKYDTTLGTFISVDPILAPSDPISLNGYTYAGNNPVTFSDPTGLMRPIDGEGAASQPESGGGMLEQVFHKTSMFFGQANSEAQSNPGRATKNLGFGFLRGLADMAVTIALSAPMPIPLLATPMGQALHSQASSTLDSWEQSWGADTGSAHHAIGGALAFTATLLVGTGEATAAKAAAQAGKVAANDGARIASRADELTGALDPIAQTRRTSAVMSTREGADVLAGGGVDLSPAQRALAQGGDVLGRMRGAHAEITAMDAAGKAGLTPWQMAVSRPICPACQAAIEGSGGTVAPGGTFAWWPW